MRIFPNKKMNRHVSSFLRHLRFALKILLGGILFAVVLRVFIMSSCRVPSWSMAPAVLGGDHVLVSKLTPGARINCADNPGKDGVTRLWGIGKVKRNDVLVFNFPYSGSRKLGFDPALYYMKRCVAIPGDTFFIEDGIYKVKGCKDTLGNFRAQKRFAKSGKNRASRHTSRCFPYDARYNWTESWFGPLYIPRKGDEIAIDTMNIILYCKLIDYETGKETYVRNEEVYLGDSPLKKYVFRKNYYFMAGDLAADSRDSRYWGLLPEDHIMGKAVLIWKSQDMKTGKYKWDRFLKRVK